MITILLATHNAEKHLEALLQSVLGECGENVKLIIRDNFSTDSTPQILARYAEVYHDKIELCPASSIAGNTAESLFKMLEQYNDDYFMLCEQNSVWLPKKIEKSLEIIKCAEEKLSPDTPILIHTDTLLNSKKEKRATKARVEFFENAPKSTGLAKAIMQNNVSGTTVMFNRALKEKLFSFPKTAEYAHWITVVAALFGEVIHFERKTAITFTPSRLGKLEKLKTGIETSRLFARHSVSLYRDMLSLKELKLLEAVDGLYSQRLTQRIKTVKKYGLYSNSILKNILTFL